MIRDTAPHPDNDNYVNVIFTELNLLHQGGFYIHFQFFSDNSQYRTLRL